MYGHLKQSESLFNSETYSHLLEATNSLYYTQKNTLVFTMPRFTLLVVLIIFSSRCLRVNSIKKHFTRLVDIQKCNSSTPPFGYIASNIFSYDFSMFNIKNKPNIRGNITIKEDISGNFLWSFLVREADDSKRFVARVDLLKMTCKDLLVRLVLMYTNVKFVPKSCTYKKGVYKFKQFDIDRVDGFVTVIPVRELGMKRLILSGYNHTETVFCVNALISIELID